jgi:hypothetical protein
MKPWPFLFFLVLVSATPLSADTIYLKDGTREKSSKIWEQNGYVHFILKGTQNVEIRYAKEIVDRIEADPAQTLEQPLPVNPSKKEPSTSNTQPADSVGVRLPQSESQPNPGKADPDGVAPKSAEATQLPVTQDQTAPFADDLAQLQAAAAKLKGISFYDPKRPHKYWATATLQYDSVEQAISGLSELYHMPSDWIESTMGDANDLGVIHQNLIAGLKGKLDAPSRPMATPAGTGKPAAGESDQNLSAKSAQTQSAEVRIEDLDGAQSEGPFFYNPRKPLKYWISESRGYKTLNEALAALAQQYHQTPEWVEAHMGQTNNLNEIHRNLGQNAESKSSLPP